MIQATHVLSSTIDAIGYHMGRLYVRFLSGTSYSYDNVPYAYFEGLRVAESAGHYLHHVIKKGAFNYKRLELDPFAQ